MTAPSLLDAARRAPDALDRIYLMAEVMRDRRGADDACTFLDLVSAGFTEAEVQVYRDAARAHIEGRPSSFSTIPAGRREGERLAKTAERLRKRNARIFRACAVVAAAHA